MMINPYATPGRVGVRPDARLAQAFLTQAFFWMFVGLLLTTGVGAVVAGMSDTQVTDLSGLFLPLIIAQLAIAFGLTLAIRRATGCCGPWRTPSRQRFARMTASIGMEATSSRSSCQASAARKRLRSRSGWLPALRRSRARTTRQA